MGWSPSMGVFFKEVKMVMLQCLEGLSSATCPPCCLKHWGQLSQRMWERIKVTVLGGDLVGSLEPRIPRPEWSHSSQKHGHLKLLYYPVPQRKWQPWGSLQRQQAVSCNIYAAASALLLPFFALERLNLRCHRHIKATILWVPSSFPPHSQSSYRCDLVFSDLKFFIKILSEYFSKNKCP